MWGGRRVIKLFVIPFGYKSVRTKSYNILKYSRAQALKHIEVESGKSQVKRLEDERKINFQFLFLYISLK